MVAKAYNGEEAIGIYSGLLTKIDFILLDQRMPGKNGLEILEAILKQKYSAKVIFISADITIKEKALASGAISFLEKPIGFSKLLEIIK